MLTVLSLHPLLSFTPHTFVSIQHQQSIYLYLEICVIDVDAGWVDGVCGCLGVDGSAGVWNRVGGKELVEGDKGKEDE